MANDDLETLDKILELMQEASDTAVQVDRNQEKRIWYDLKLLMSGDHIDFAHVKVLLPKFLTNYGSYDRITPELIDELTRYIDAMHDLHIKIRTKQKFPDAPMPPLRVLTRKYGRLKSKWDKTMLYAMKIVNIDTNVKFDKFALLQVLGKQNTNGSKSFEDYMEDMS